MCAFIAKLFIMETGNELDVFLFLNLMFTVQTGAVYL